MFERGNVTQGKRRQFEVRVTLASGNTLRGGLVGAHDTLREFLDSNSQFIELVDQVGVPRYVAKHAICQIEPMDLPDADQLERGQKRLETENSYRILGVDSRTDEAGLIRTYHRLSKAYHPDRLTALELPVEIIEYAAAMQRRINLAFDEVRSKLPKAQKAQRNQNIEDAAFESRPFWAED